MGEEDADRFPTTATYAAGLGNSQCNKNCRISRKIGELVYCNKNCLIGSKPEELTYCKLLCRQQTWELLL